MSRESRVHTIKTGMGKATKANLDHWSARAERHSFDAPGNTGARDTGKRAEAKSDKNHSGTSSHMRGVRRES